MAEVLTKELVAHQHDLVLCPDVETDGSEDYVVVDPEVLPENLGLSPALDREEQMHWCRNTKQNKASFEASLANHEEVTVCLIGQ